MIKRVFKLNSTFKGLGRQTFLERKRVQDSVEIVPDKETGALKLVYKESREGEYIILVPGEPSFIVIKISRAGFDALLNALRELVKTGVLERGSIDEIECIAELYLLLEKVSREQLKIVVKEVIEKEVAKILESISDEDFLVEFLPSLKTIVPRVSARKILKRLDSLEKVRRCFSDDELERIFVEELVLGDVESFVWRFVRKYLPSKA